MQKYVRINVNLVRSRQELSHEYLRFSIYLQNRLRYSRERASQTSKVPLFTYPLASEAPRTRGARWTNETAAAAATPATANAATGSTPNHDEGLACGWGAAYALFFFFRAQRTKDSRENVEKCEWKKRLRQRAAQFSTPESSGQ